MIISGGQLHAPPNPLPKLRLGAGVRLYTCTRTRVKKITRTHTHVYITRQLREQIGRQRGRPVQQNQYNTKKYYFSIVALISLSSLVLLSITKLRHVRVMKEQDKFYKIFLPLAS